MENGKPGIEAALDMADPLSGSVIGAAIEVHKFLGPGLLESAYESCLAHELKQQGIRCEAQVAVPVTYKGLELGIGYRMDLLVEDVLVIEVKAVESLLPIHDAQLLTYLRLAKKKTGLLINFHAAQLRHGLKRMVF